MSSMGVEFEYRGTRCPEYTEHKERMSTVEAASSWVTG
jgi:hypothetical protein